MRQVGQSCFIPLDGTGLTAGDVVDVTLRPSGVIVLTPMHQRAGARSQRRRPVRN
jgi:hypothetical protein